MRKKIIEGILTLDYFQKSDGENMYIADIVTPEGNNLYNLLGEFDEEKIKITIETM